MTPKQAEDRARKVITYTLEHLDILLACTPHKKVKPALEFLADHKCAQDQANELMKFKDPKDYPEGGVNLIAIKKLFDTGVIGPEWVTLLGHAYS